MPDVLFVNIFRAVELGSRQQVGAGHDIHDPLGIFRPVAGNIVERVAVEVDEQSHADALLLEILGDRPCRAGPQAEANQDHATGGILPMDAIDSDFERALVDKGPIIGMAETEVVDVVPNAGKVGKVERIEPMNQEDVDMVSLRSGGGFTGLHHGRRRQRQSRPQTLAAGAECQATGEESRRRPP